jgi:3-hydroxyisobutyrate dehydrogenase
MEIGVCGTGKMGAAIARRLLAVGHQVVVWNRDAAKTAPLLKAGAERADTPAVVASRCQTIITMLLNGAAVESVYTAANGLLSGEPKGRLFIEMSTVPPRVEENIARLVADKSAHFVECPVGGTVGPAAEGKLFGFAGGSPADFERARPILESLCRRVEYVGPAGAGAKLKLAVNLPLLVYWRALGEALALCRSLDLPPARLIDILSDTSGTAAAMKMRGGAIAAALSGGPSGPAAFDLSGARKDLAMMVEFGASLGEDLSVTAAALAGFDEAIAAGFGNEDAAMAAVYTAQRGKSR